MMTRNLGWVGSVINKVLDVGSFGFYSSYGKATDDYSQGTVSETASKTAKAHTAARTFAIGIIAVAKNFAIGKLT